MGILSHKTQCPTEGCDGAGDNLAVYEDGSTFCHACHYVEPSKGEITVRTEKKEVPLVLEYITHKPIKTRGISEETATKFGVGFTSEFLIFNYYTTSGSVYGQKLKTKDKKFQTRGSSLGLYGQHLWEPNDKLKLVVTEGELDALAVSQMQDNKWPVVSIPSGAMNAKKSLLSELEYIKGFKEVILMFDNDSAGRVATEQCLEALPKYMCKVAKLPDGVKDANQLLLDGRESELQGIVWNAVSEKVKDIVSPLDIANDVLSDVTFGTPTPWKSLDDISYGIRRKEIHIVAAANSVGKTQYLLEILYSMIDQGRKVGVFSFEQSPADTMRRMIGFSMNKQIHIPGTEYNKTAALGILESLQGKIFLYDQQGSSTLEHTANLVTYLSKAHGVSLFLIDNLKGVSQGNRDKLAEIMLRLQSLAFQLNVTFILVSHVTKSSISLSKHISDKEGSKKGLDVEGLTWESGRVLSKENIYGASEVGDMADLITALSRNTISEDEAVRNTLHVKCLKNRLDGSKAGKSFTLRYTEEGRLVEQEKIVDNILAEF